MPHPLRLVLRLTAIIFLLVDRPVTGLAQLPIFRNYNTKDGLPSSETYCIEQDNRGYIYIGTDKGLTRFDGRHFETLTTRDGLVNNTIFSLLVQEDKLWYFTYSSMVGYLKQDAVYQYTHNPAIRQIMRSGLMSDILPCEDGTLYLNKGTYEHGSELIRIKADGSTDRFRNIPSDPDHTNIYLTPYKHCLRTGSHKARKVNLYYWKTGKFIHSFEVRDKNPHPAFLVCAYQSDSVTWLLYRDIYKLKGNNIHKVISNSEQALYMLADKDENIWIGYQNTGLALYRKNDNYRRPIRLLAGYSIYGMMEDREGGLWFTTLENGVYYLPPGFLLAYDERTGLTRAKVVRVGSFGQNVAVQQSDFSISLIKSVQNGSSFRRLPGKFPSAILFDRDGLIYSTSPPGRRQAATRNYVYVPVSHLFYSGNQVWGTLEDRLSQYNSNGHKKYDLPVKVPYVICLYELGDGRLLLGTFEGLLLYINGWLQRLDLNSSVFEERISDIRELDKDHLIVATSGKGLLVLDKASCRIVKHITAANGLKNMICNVARSDDSGVVWVGTNRGLYKIKHILKEPGIQYADVHDGINSNEINDICIVGQDVWLATSEGISIFPRSRKLLFEDSIPVRIYKLTVNGERLNTAEALHLNYSQNNIGINFAGLNYQYADVLQYRYRLIGDGKGAWSYTSDPFVNYNALPPGTYIFEYGAMAPNQHGKIFTASFPFTIAPPFWQRWWFIVFLALMILCCISLFIRYRVRTIQKQVKLETDLSIYRDKALRDQMSPHFIYNALNTIQNYILKHDTDMSVSFLSKFSRLMRLIFNNTVQEVIPIQKDLEALYLYTEMESMRFPGKLNFYLAEKLPEHLKQALIPPLILQPFVENAILHGLLPKNPPGNIWLTIEQVSREIRISIKDDGIGRVAAAKIKSKKRAFLNRDELRPSRRHSGTTITIARIAQAWGKFPTQSRFKITDLYHPDGSPAGTFIQFYLPLHYDKSNNS